ncbi:MAG: UDP-N-acetylglucosamine 2-epimerase (non-hydrolyzing) [Actinomycetota bacterium]|nr:UDP-N-acetylglucosamine 2-epimerase (non-hydrolyzing) [Actinomycetota bacterium]
MKIMTILGTRPEIIRLSRTIPLLDKFSKHVLVNTGQNYTKELNDIFFDELNLRKPDYLLDTRSENTFEQISKILYECEKIILKEKPDRILLLGDTNSALTAMIAKRYFLKIFHMEAGNRCYDDRVPEEINRRIIDHCSDILMPYTERSRQNLLKEGISGEKIFVIGNPIKEVLDFYNDKIDNSDMLKKLKLKRNLYFLVTLHRSENVDMKERLINFILSFENISKKYDLPVILSLHPRTRSKLDSGRYFNEKSNVKAITPPGLFDFIKLEQNAACVLTDSGTVQEECCIFKIPNVTIRDVTERPETLESGSNIISGNNPDDVLNAVSVAIENKYDWQPPVEYLEDNVSMKVLKIISGFYK